MLIVARLLLTTNSVGSQAYRVKCLVVTRVNICLYSMGIRKQKYNKKTNNGTETSVSAQHRGARWPRHYAERERIQYTTDTKVTLNNFMR